MGHHTLHDGWKYHSFVHRKSNLQPWDGYGWPSTVAVVVTFLLNGIVSVMALCAVPLFLEGFGEPLAAVVLWIAGLLTVLHVITRTKSARAKVLQWMALGSNTGVVIYGVSLLVIELRSTAASSSTLALIMLAIGVTNLFCMTLVQQFYVGTQCPLCGYDLRGLLRKGCPECGWRREADDAAR